jgi:serine/threonine protein kinase
MVGETFGNYEVVATLGKGGVGVVYLAQHHTIARRAAIKVLAPELSKDRDVVKRFFLEALATSLIRHPGIVEVFDYDVEPSGRAYIVMEYLEGESLAECLERSGSLPWQTACAIAQRIASAVGAAHAHGVVHRDLKPGNVFVSRVVGSFDVTERRIKVLDFGLAKLLSDDRGTERITRAGMLLGTPMYISPEQCTGADQAMPSADIYALGCILFEMINGRPPFERDGIRAILAAHMFEAPPRVPGVPVWLEELILRMLAKKPEDRPGSMDEVAEALATAGREDAGLTWLMPGSATAMLPGVVLPTPMPHRFPWRPALRLPRLSRIAPHLRLSRIAPYLRLSRIAPRLHLSRIAPHLRLSRLARLRLSFIERPVWVAAGVAAGLVALVAVGAFAFSRGGPPPQRAAASLAAATARVVAVPATVKIADSGLLTPVDSVRTAEPPVVAAPEPAIPTQAIQVPAPDQAPAAEQPAPPRRRIGEAPARRRPEPSRVRAPAVPDGIVDL